MEVGFSGHGGLGERWLGFAWKWKGKNRILEILGVHQTKNEMR